MAADKGIYVTFFFYSTARSGYIDGGGEGEVRGGERKEVGEHTREKLITE